MRKYTAIILSLLSLVISVAVALSWFIHFKNSLVTDVESYISVIVTSLGIIVTIVLGWQIYNVIDYKEKVKEIGTIKQDFTRLRTDIEDANKDLEVLSYEINAQEFSSKKCYGLAVLAYMKGLLALLDKSDLNKSMFDIEVVLGNIEKYSRATFTWDHVYFKEDLKEYIEKWDNEIRSHKNYPFIKAKYEGIYKIMFETQKWV